MGSDARIRILYELLLEGRRFGARHQKGVYIIKMHVYELAARTGLTRETASRELSKIKSLGIKINKQGIEVQNLNKLEDELDKIT